MERRCIHLFSSLSLFIFASVLTGADEIKLTTEIRKDGLLSVSFDKHLLKCLATVVSLSCSMSLKCPWNSQYQVYLPLHIEVNFFFTHPCVLVVPRTWLYV